MVAKERAPHETEAQPQIVKNSYKRLRTRRNVVAEGRAPHEIHQRLFACAEVWTSHVSVLQCVAVCCSVLPCVAVCCSVLQCAAVCCSLLQYVAVCCSVLQCVAVCCNVFLRLFACADVVM